MLARLRSWAHALRRATLTFYLAARHPRTPWHARVLALIVVAYALSPIDLIPDPIPILGQLDDLVLLPVGFWITRRLVPDDVWQECERDAAARADTRLASSRAAAVVIALLWLLALYLTFRGIAVRV